MLTPGTLASTVASGTAGSTHLLGAFAGGMAFATAEGATEAWAANERVNAWLYSVFFLSVGFRIPTRDMFRLGGFGLGIGYAVPAIVGKLVTGFLVGGDVRKALVVGWAMVGRGELGFSWRIRVRKRARRRAPVRRVRLGRCWRRPWRR